MHHSPGEKTGMSYSRKDFLIQSAKVAGGLGILAVPGIAMAGEKEFVVTEYTVNDIINTIYQEIPGAPFKNTVDTIKTGRGDQKVSGVITTMFATVEVIHETIRRKANFIIAHEPTFYNHQDDHNWVRDNTVVLQKEKLLNENGIAVWRFHDHCHFFKPDFVSYGVAQKAGWLDGFKPGKTILEIPFMTLQQLVEHLKRSLSISHLRIIGDLQQSCKKLSIIPGAAGGQMQVAQVLAEKPDVLIIGEASEWETVEFIRDSRLLGGSTALIVLGHSVSEEPGMARTAEWLKAKMPGLAIDHIASGDPFTWL
jgi:putative NIF3 family GTP cyclohydrolase 1 type 2